MDIFKALSNKKRIEILKLLAKKEMHISKISRELGISTPVTLRHIRVLEKANLVTRKKLEEVTF